MRVIRITDGARYGVTVIGSGVTVWCASKNQAGAWIHLRKMHAASRHRVYAFGEFPHRASTGAFARVIWVKTTCPCCGQLTDAKRRMNPKLRDRLSELRQRATERAQ